MTRPSDTTSTLGKSIVRVVRLERKPDGTTERVLLYGKEAPKRKVSRMYRPYERMLRRWVEAQQVFAETYLDRHERSTRKKRDGYSRDFWENMDKSRRKAQKRLRLSKIIKL